MALHNYWLFVGASIVLAIIPGPDMAYVLARCIARGRRAGLIAAVGCNLGGYFHLTAATSGVVQHARRSSIWSRTPSGWMLKFHQGTPYQV